MVEVVKLSRDDAPKEKGVNYEKGRQTVKKQNEYASENILRNKYEKNKKENAGNCQGVFHGADLKDHIPVSEDKNFVEVSPGCYRRKF